MTVFDKISQFISKHGPNAETHVNLKKDFGKAVAKATGNTHDAMNKVKAAKAQMARAKDSVTPQEFRAGMDRMMEAANEARKEDREDRAAADKVRDATNPNAGKSNMDKVRDAQNPHAGDWDKVKNAQSDKAKAGSDKVTPEEFEAQKDKLISGLNKMLANSNKHIRDKEAAQQAEEKKAKEDAQVNEAVEKVDKAAKDNNALVATQVLKDELSKLPPERRAEFLDKLNQKGTIERIAKKVKDLDKEDTARTVEELANAVDLVDELGPSVTKKITAPIAKVIADGDMEQKGADADAGWLGFARGANTHHSEREFVDSIAALGDTHAAQQFKKSLTASLIDEGDHSQGDRQNRAYGMANAVNSGNSSLVPDKGVWTMVRNIDKLRDKMTDHVVDDVTHLSESIDKLKPGETLTISGSLKIAAGASAKASGSVEITRNDDGTYTVRGSAELLAGGSVKVLEGLGGVSGTAEFKFNSADEAKQGAQALIKLSMVPNAIANPAMGVFLPSTSEAKLLQSHLTAIELDPKGSASIDLRAGIDGNTIGAEAETGASVGVRLEIENGELTAVTVTTSLNNQGTAELSGWAAAIAAKLPFAHPLAKTIADKLKSNVGSLEGSITVTQRFSLKDLPGGDLSDQINAIKQDPSAYIEKTAPETTMSLKLSGEWNNKGFEVELKVENVGVAQTKEFMEKCKEGDISSAIDALSDETLTYREYEDKKQNWIDREDDLIFVSFKGENSIRTYSDPKELNLT